jgi:RNA polymerase sigma factor (sigma-70 family)
VTAFVGPLSRDRFFLSLGPNWCVDEGVAPSDDRALVASLRAGDSVAFGRVHAAYGPRIFNFLARMTGQREVAEDLYQEMWIKLAMHAARLAEDTDLGAWLYTVARNLARSEKRSARARPAGGAVLPEEAPHPGPSPYDWTAATQTEARLERALAELPVPFREVLLLVVVDGLDHQEVAKILDLSAEALRQRLSRARAKLTERLEKGPRPV